MRVLSGFVVLVLFLSCGGDDDNVQPPSPEGAVLVFPSQNSECTTGIDVSDTLSQVTFEWQSGLNTDNYTLTVINLFTNTTRTVSTADTIGALTIEKGTPFSWSVLSTNSNSDETATSDSWLFYNAGPQNNYAPFPAQIIVPKPGRTVQKDGNDQILLRWSGADVEEDIATFEVYFSDQNPPEELLLSSDSDTTEALAPVQSATVYYWRVVTIDASGNTSDSGVYDFRVF